MPDRALLPDLGDDELYLRHLVTCAALGVKPVSIERARELIGEWSSTIAAAIMH
jgi:hypothetical protein